MTVVLVVNAVLAAASAAFGVLAIASPGTLVGHGTVDASTRYYAQMYAVRAIPLGGIAIAGCLTAAFSADAHTLALVLLIGMGVSQVGDAAIGVRHRIVGMTTGAGVAALVHLGSAIALAS